MNKRKPPKPEITFICPECGSSEVTLIEEQMFMANTMERYCMMVKSCDDYAKSTCQDCEWKGERRDLKEPQS